MRTSLQLLSATILSVSVASCAVPVVAGVGATAAFVGLQERSAEQVALDTKIKVHIKDRLTQKNYKYFGDIGVAVFENEVLLTGIVPTKEAGEEILNIVRTTPDIASVYNELFVGSEYTTRQKAQDAWLATTIKPRLIGNRQAFPINYSISVVNGHVYIIGYVTSEEEHEHVLHILRTTKGVSQVHDYLRPSPTGKDPRKEKSYKENIKQEAPSAMPEDSYGN